MSRRAPTGPPATQEGWIYTLHLLPAYGDERQLAKHYTGFTTDLPARLEAHEKGGQDAARLLQAQKAAGGTWRLADLEWGTRDREAQLKERGAARRCPVCKAEREGTDPPDIPLPALSFPGGNPLAGRTSGPGAPAARAAARTVRRPGTPRRRGSSPARA